MQKKTKALVVHFCFLLFSASFLWAEPDPPLAEPHPEKYQVPTAPLGILGVPLGTFAVIEGVEHPHGMGVGMTGFSIEKINGKPAPPNCYIQTDWPAPLKSKRLDDKHYVLHGYEVGDWGGEPTGLPNDEPYSGQLAGFYFFHSFMVTSVENFKLTDEDLKRLKPDPTKPLQPPSSPPQVPINYRPPPPPPLGILGLPLGTFAVIEATPCKGPIVLNDPFVLVHTVNGKKIEPPLILSVRRDALKGDERVILHGYEVADWTGRPPLPESEPHDSPSHPHMPFQLFEQFIVTKQVTPVTK